MAYTFLLESRIISITFVTIEMSDMAPNGHPVTHAPQLMHFSLSIFAISFSSIVIASTGHTFTHGLTISTIAEYGQASAHLPQFLHSVLSITDPLGVLDIAAKWTCFYTFMG